MDRRSTGGLSGYHVAAIAGATVVASATAAVSVLLIVRRRTRAMISRGRQDPSLDSALAEQPIDQSVVDPAVPHHFSEDLVIPGLTRTGVEIVQEDESNGRSPEGV